MQRASQLAPRALYKGSKPTRDALYRRFVKGFACASCGSTRCVDPAHTGGRGLGTKSDDRQCLPLCRQCHEAFDSNPRGFAAAQGLDIAALILGFNALWESRQRKTA